MGPNFEMYLGYQTIAGYNPLYLHRYYEYIRAYNKDLLSPGAVWFFYSPNGKRILMDLLNVKYEISHDGGTYSLRKTYFPRAFVVPGHKIVKKEEALDYMSMPHFDPRKQVLFEREDSHHLPLYQASSLHRQNGISEAEILSYKPDEIKVSVHADEAGYLFLSEVYYPGWKAFVDDLEEPILRGNYLFRVIKVPKGDHVIKLVFDPMSIKSGIGITIFTLITVLAITIYHFTRRRFSSNKTGNV